MLQHSAYLKGEVSHAAYYGQFVTPGIKDAVAYKIGVGRLMDSADPHFNDISLYEWDRLSVGVSSFMFKLAGDHLSVAGAVCVLKEAARQIVRDLTPFPDFEPDGTDKYMVENQLEVIAGCSLSGDWLEWALLFRAIRHFFFQP